MPMLEIQDIHKSFGEREVLKGVGLTVEKGAVVAILGPSGSGKTTLLRCINFLEKADSGSLLFDGERVDLARVSRADVARLRRKTAFVFQSYNLFRNKTVLQNVTEGLIVARRMHKDQAEAIAVQMLEKVGIPSPEQRIKEYPHQLSGGMRQRVMIAMALSCNPKLLIADEPTTALDVTIQAQILRLMRQLTHDFNTSVILITHDMGVVAEMGSPRLTRITEATSAPALPTRWRPGSSTTSTSARPKCSWASAA